MLKKILLFGSLLLPSVAHADVLGDIPSTSAVNFVDGVSTGPVNMSGQDVQNVDDITVRNRLLLPTTNAQISGIGNNEQMLFNLNNDVDGSDELLTNGSTYIVYGGFDEPGSIYWNLAGQMTGFGTSSPGRQWHFKGNGDLGEWELTGFGSTYSDPYVSSYDGGRYAPVWSYYWNKQNGQAGAVRDTIFLVTSEMNRSDGVRDEAVELSGVWVDPAQATLTSRFQVELRANGKSYQNRGVYASLTPILDLGAYWHVGPGDPLTASSSTLGGAYFWSTRNNQAGFTAGAQPTSSMGSYVQRSTPSVTIEAGVDEGTFKVCIDTYTLEGDTFNPPDYNCMVFDTTGLSVNGTPVGAGGSGGASSLGVYEDGVEESSPTERIDFKSHFEVTETASGITSVRISSDSLTANQLGADSVSASELNATGVEAELEAALDLNELQGQVADAQIADAAVDGGTGGEIADGSVTAADLGADSVAASELDAAAVESELEGVLDLQDMQGAVTDAQVPNNITVTGVETMPLPIQSAKLTGGFVAFTPTGLDAQTASAELSASDGNWRILFDATTDEGIFFQRRLPDYWTGHSELKLGFTMASATANEVEWEAAIMCVTPGDSADINTASFASGSSAVVTVPGTAGFLAQANITLTDDSCAAGDLIYFVISTDANDGTNDDATGDRELVTADYEFTK